MAEGGALLRRYGGECLHRGFESLLLRFNHLGSRYQRLQGRTDDVTVMAGQLVDVVREVRGVPRPNVRRMGRADGNAPVVDLPWLVAEEPHVASRQRPSVGASLTSVKRLESRNRPT